MRRVFVTLSDAARLWASVGAPGPRRRRTSRGRSSSPSSATRGTGDSISRRGREAARTVPRAVSVRVRDHAGRQPVRHATVRTTTRGSSSSRTSRCSTPASSSTRRSATMTIPNQRIYKPFNMNGERYYSLQAVTDGERPLLRARQQLHGPEAARSGSRRSWRPAARTGRSRSSTIRRTRPADARLDDDPARAARAAVREARRQRRLHGHEHFYERIKPQKGIQYFVLGSSAKLRKGDINATGLTAVGYDAGLHVHARSRSTATSCIFQTISDRRGSRRSIRATV